MAGIVYISETRPDLLDDICNESFAPITAKIRETNLKELVIKKGANLSHADPLVVDLSAIKDTAGEIAEAIGSFKQMYPNKKVAVIADKENPNSPVFSQLINTGIYNIALNLEADTLRKCLFTNMTRDDIFFMLSKNPEITATDNNISKDTQTAETATEIKEKITANREFKKHKDNIFVAVCGTERHIGATHQALIMTKFLCDAGFKACYLEANKRRNISYIADFYSVNANVGKRLIQFEGIDIYYEPKMNEILTENYDFIIFDFGDFSEIETPATFLTKDIKIIVGGVKAWEIPIYSEIAKKIEGSRGVNFIINFAPPSEFEAIKKSMTIWEIHFSEYAPFPFSSGVNIEIYKKIFGDYLTVESIQTPAPSSGKKKNILKFWR